MVYKWRCKKHEENQFDSYIYYSDYNYIVRYVFRNYKKANCGG